MYKILIIEDDEIIREELKLLLSNAGYSVECIADFDDVIGQVKADGPDLILLDVNLPGQDGYRLCTSIRSFTATPILFITGRNTAMDELQALTLGGDDFISKPYNIPVMLARISLLLKKGKGNGQPDYVEYRGVKLKPVAGTLLFDCKEAELTKTELKILYVLFTRPGKIVSRLDLIEYLWDNGIHMDDNTLSVNMMRIRGKLRELGLDNFIQTKRGMGYKI
ncbi:response regulator transcription factor [Diplocloster agilis]|uniref:Stage 0 sporulation protein A homolog n=1 Tax=Diplocloster agilis TaxID=2850323 RepID=A0A949NEV7_9FIRM|nr:response regulator transcription factor [Diplocloster agilis]MBU9737671.1 response regulator transcription factor [Diplocloster agilis]